MSTRQTDKKESRQELMNAYYSYIGEYHLSNISDEIEINKNQIENIAVPESMNIWFTEYISKIKKKEQQKKILGKGKRILARVAIILLFLVMSMTIVTLSVEALRVRVFNFLLTETEKYSSVRIVEEQLKANNTDPGEEYYYPTNIPAGFDVDSTNKLRAPLKTSNFL